MDMTQSIAPKSDQLNAEDLLTGPRTFTIKEVKEGSSEQPVNVHLVEFPGRPFKPSKTVRRLMVAAWGKDTTAYVGRRMTLYRDPAVKFGGMDVGGIRVSHMSHIDKRIVVALTVTRGKRAPYTVEPLKDAPETAPVGPKSDEEWPNQLTESTRKRMFAVFGKHGIVSRDEQIKGITGVIGRRIESRSELTEDEAQRVILAVEAHFAATD